MFFKSLKNSKTPQVFCLSSLGDRRLHRLARVTVATKRSALLCPDVLHFSRVTVPTPRVLTRNAARSCLGPVRLCLTRLGPNSPVPLSPVPPVCRYPCLGLVSSMRGGRLLPCGRRGKFYFPLRPKQHREFLHAVSKFVLGFPYFC